MSAAQRRFTVAPFDLHSRAGVNDGIFERLDYAISREIVRLGGIGELQGEDQELKPFLDWCRGRLDPGRYATIQARHLTRGAKRDDAKFLNFVYYVRSKMPMVMRLGVHEAPPRKILDIGCGPGHFALIAGYYGHSVLGLDLPLPGHVFTDLCRLFGAPKVDHRVEPYKPLPDCGRFDLVTAFLTTFDMFEDLSAWPLAAWRYFIDDCFANRLKPGGALFLGLTSRQMCAAPRDPAVYDFLASIATWRKNRSFLIERNGP